MEKTTPITSAEEGQDEQLALSSDATSQTSVALVTTPKPPWKRVFEAFQALWKGTCKTLQGFCRWVTTWFIPHVAVALLALILFGGWVQLQPLRAAADWLHPMQRASALSWCISTKEGWPSVGQAYPPGDQAPSVPIAPGLWCNAFHPTKGVATQMRRLFPDLG